MDNRPIGVFDSGLGGLTAVRQIQTCMPNESIVYFGDTGRVPYGGRSRETIVRYAKQDMALLLEQGIKAIVVACGTVSAVALPEHRRHTAIPIVGVVEPASEKAIHMTKNGNIGIIGTVGTIESGSYEATICRMKQGMNLFSKACPLFVPLVEEGRFAKDDRVTNLVVEEYLAGIKAQNVDAMILGCTHYPLLEDIIGRFMGEDVYLVSPGQEAANAAKRLLAEQGLEADRQQKGTVRYFVSDAAREFRAFAGMFLGEPVKEEVQLVDISQYGG